MKSSIRRLAVVIVLGLGALGWIGGTAEAQVPNKINYQGKLTDSAGQPINATVSVVFHLYNVASGGSALYTETQTVTVSNGLFNVAIGSVTPLGLPFDVPYYLGVKVGADAEMTPRQAVLSGAYALQAASAEALAATATVGGAQITGAISTATLPAASLSGTVGTAQIANNAVTQAKLSPLSGAAAGNVLGTDGTNLVWQSASGSTLTGSGITNFLAKWTPTGSALGDSAIYENAGLVGINRSSPAYTLDILGGNAQINLQSSVNSTTALLSRYTNRFEIQPSDGFQVSVGGIAAPHFWVGPGGKVGIGTTIPASTLQIGSVGASGYKGDDIAFGDGTQASGIAQTAGVAQWFSTTSIALMPTNGLGYVGINTITPIYPLDVQGYNGNFSEFLAYFRLDGVHSEQIITPQVSISASNNVLALEFDAMSDSRIKNVMGISDSAKDLDTINGLQVTDYTLKDKVGNGPKAFKKVIAQQVETVYPQVVSKHVDFIPNVYQAASRVTKTDRGTLLHFDFDHHLSAQAKRIKLLASGEHTMQRVGVVSIPSDHDVLIDATTLHGDKVFVYGEEVDDFRTVDYEGLTTLNISATQELAKRQVRLQKDMAALVIDKDAQVADLRQRLDSQTARIAELEQQTAEIAALKQDRVAFHEQAAELATLKVTVARMAETQEQAAALTALQTRLGVK